MDGSPARQLPVPSPSPRRRQEKKPERRLPMPRRIKTKSKWFSVRQGQDMTFLFLVLTLLIIGLIMMFSASYPSAYAETGDSLSYLKRQLLYAGGGLLAMMFFSYLDYRKLR